MNLKKWKKSSIEELKENKFYSGDDIFWLETIIDKLLEKYNLTSDTEIDDELDKTLNSDLNKLLQGQPIEQILGYTYFYGVKIGVYPDVLIPRPDSETMIETIKDYIPYLKSLRQRLTNEEINILEIGIGSGALSICLAKLLDSYGINYKILASDISSAAISASSKNIQAHELGEKINVELADLWPSEVVQGNYKIDLLLSNPPYISESEIEDESMLEFEPKIALIADNDGLELYDRIFIEAKKYLNYGALVFLEHGHEQKQALINLAKKNYNYIKTEKDLGSRDRISVFINN